jgi:heat shock protein HslJ
MKSKILALLLSIAVLAACGGTPPAAPASLAGTNWVVQELRGQSLAAGSAITLNFTADQISGSAGCNGYGGSYEAQGDQLTLGEIIRTMMYCENPAGVMDQEDDYLAALDTVGRYRTAGDRLELLDRAGQVVVALAPAPPPPTVALEGTEWVLTAFLSRDTAASALNGTEITLRLEGGKVSGTAGCNSYTGSYTLQDGTVAFGPMASTRMYCQDPAGVMDQEGQYLDLLQRATSFGLDGSTLTLSTADGDGLVFSAR